MLSKVFTMVLTVAGLSLCAGKVLNAKDFGAKGDGVADDRPALTKLFDAAAAAGAGAKVVIPKGVYRMKSLGVTRKAYAGHLLAKGLKDAEVEAEPGTVFLMTKRANGLMISNCDNTVFKNIAVDYDPLPFTQGKVVAFDRAKNTIDVLIDKGFPSPLDKGFIGKPARNRINFYDPKTRRRIRAIPINWVDKAFDLGNGKIRIPLRNKVRPYVKVRAGLLFALISRGGSSKGHGIFVQQGRETKLYKTAVYSAYGCAYALRDCDRAVMDGCLVTTKPGTDRLMTTDADGIHAKFNRRGPIIENCKIMYTDDDCVNIAGGSFRLCEQLAPNKIVVDIHGNRKVGDEYVFFDFKTGNVLARAKSTGCRRVKWQKYPKFELTLDRDLPELDTVKSLNHQANWRLSIGARKGFLKNGSPAFIYNNSATGKGSIIRNNFFGHNWPRGIMIRANDALIENNTFEDILGPAIIAGHDLIWGEGPNSCGLKVVNNTFNNISRTNIQIAECAVLKPEAGRAITDVLIKGNRITNFGTPSYHGRGRVGDAITAKNATNLVIENNVFGPPAKDVMDPKLPYVEIDYSDNVTVKNNQIIPASKKKWLLDKSSQ